MKVLASTHVNAPIDITFAVFSDVAQIADRIDGIIKVEMLSEIQQGIGTRWRETRVMFGREATEEMEISVFEENRSYEVVAESHGAEYHSVYTFAEKDGGTQVSMVFSAKPISLMAKVMTPLGYLMKGTAQKAFEADMSALKSVAEEGGNA